MNLLILEVVWAAAIASQAVLVVAIAFFSVFFLKCEMYINLYRDARATCYAIHTGTVVSGKQSITLPSVHVMGIGWKGEVEASQAYASYMYSS